MAQIIEFAPDRVRKRLDRKPDLANDWVWESGSAKSTIDTGSERVTLNHGVVTSTKDLRCTCLLSPNCFHVLACLSVLDVAEIDEVTANIESIEESGAAKSEQSDKSRSQHENDSNKRLVHSSNCELNDKQRRGAAKFTTAIASILVTGAAHSGVIVQAGLLRHVHNCRAEGLHRLAGQGLRVVTGIKQIRRNSNDANPAGLANDVAAALETAMRLQRNGPVEEYWVGAARRKQSPVRPRRLLGLFAEPVVTRSGYAGASVYLLGEDEKIYTVSDIRPGGPQLARDAYRGGIQIGSLTESANKLARGVYLGTDLTASSDGRLGKGKSIKLASHGHSTWDSPPVAGRFAEPLSKQWDRVYQSAGLPQDARSADWDLVFFSASLVGAEGAELCAEEHHERHLLRLAIENDHPQLNFRENLRMLSQAPGLRIWCIGRVDINCPTRIYLLSVAQCAANATKPDAPSLNLPDSFQHRICLGFDELKRMHITDCGSSPELVDEESRELQLPPLADEPLAALQRRWVSCLLAGGNASAHGSTVARERANLVRNGYLTGAQLFDQQTKLRRQVAESEQQLVDSFTAVAIYLRTCRLALAKSQIDMTE